MLLIIDNYDSFTYNLVQLVEAAGADVQVVRNDAIDVAAIRAIADSAHGRLSGILVSPGPGDPGRAGASLDAIAVAAERRIPLLGVCLGMQALGAAFGADVVRAPTLVHGAASQVTHRGRGLIGALPSPFAAARYHSLCVDPASLPAELEVTASTDDGIVMGLRHRDLPLEGVQFHPESVLTPDGPRLIAAFLAWIREGDPAVLRRSRDFALEGAS